MSTQEKANNKYLHVDGLLLDLIIKKPRLSVAKIFNNNRILSEWNFSQPSRCEDFFHLNVLKNSQPKPQICSWRRMGTRFWKPCNLNCRKSWVRCLPASPIRCSTTFHETTFCWIKILYLLSIKSFLELFSVTGFLLRYSKCIDNYSLTFTCNFTLIYKLDLKGEKSQAMIKPTWLRLDLCFSFQSFFFIFFNGFQKLETSNLSPFINLIISSRSVVLSFKVISNFLKKKFVSNARATRP